MSFFNRGAFVGETQNCHQSINGLWGAQLEHSTNQADDQARAGSSITSSTDQCCRSRGYLHHQYNHRRLFDHRSPAERSCPLLAAVRRKPNQPLPNTANMRGYLVKSTSGNAEEALQAGSTAAHQSPPEQMLVYPTGFMGRVTLGQENADSLCQCPADG